MTRTVLLVFGSPARSETEAQLLRWYEPHLEQMGSLPGIVCAQLYRPGERQLAPSTTPLPGTLGLYVYETDDFATAFEATWASHREGVRTGRYVPGRSIPVPAEERMLGVVSAQLYRPSALQAPRLTTKLPEVLAVYEYNNGSELGDDPPWGDALIPDRGYRPACYDLASRGRGTPDRQTSLVCWSDEGR